MSGSTSKMTAAQQRQEFCVRWNSHLGSIGAAFPQLLAGQRFVDVTLACEGHQVHCHRLVLAACSSYFESILAENPCKHPVIILPSEIKLWEIQALVDFMYKGEVNVTLAGLPNLLRCAEQLRIRGLYGSDAALNLNQLKALTNKVSAAAVNAVNATTVGSANNTNDSTETDNESATTTTTNNTVAASTAMTVVHDALVDGKKVQVHQQQQNGTVAITQQQQQQQQQQQFLLQQQHQQQQQNNAMHQMNVMLKQETNASIVTEDESADESASNIYDNDEEYSQKPSHHTETTLEEDGSYVGNDDDSFGGVETEHEISGSGSLGGSNNYMMQKLADGGSAYKRIRRSEDSLAQAAKCVSKGQTFQTVSNMFNIPVSTIRFYMARKGILPKRKRGRGASTTGAATATTSNLSNTVMSHALAHMKRSDSPTMDVSYNMIGYNLPEETAANII